MSPDLRRHMDSITAMNCRGLQWTAVDCEVAPQIRTALKVETPGLWPDQGLSVERIFQIIATHTPAVKA